MNREQIKALALQHGFTLRDNDDLRPYVYEFAEALRAALTSDRNFCQRCGKRLLPESAAHTCTHPSDFSIGYLNTNAHLESRLAESQAREAKLREVLQQCDEAMSYMSEYDIPLMLPDNVKTALATPDDGTALRERLKVERERCARIFEESDGKLGSLRDRMYETHDAHVVAAEAIRALGDE